MLPSRAPRSTGVDGGGLVHFDPRQRVFMTRSMAIVLGSRHGKSERSRSMFQAIWPRHRSTASNGAAGR